jgi:tetratricopeptide (TPR) repeat protein
MSVDKTGVDKISEKLNITGAAGEEEKQIKVLQFLKKIKLSRDRASLTGELKEILSAGRECGESIYYQLLHSDLVTVRRFAIDFYLLNPLSNLKVYVKNIILIEDDLENLKACLKIAAGTIDRSELQAIFNGVIAKSSKKNDIILEFLKGECASLNIDYGRMLENAHSIREQERKKRAEKYDKNTSDEGVTLGGALSEKIKNPAFVKYAAAALISLILLTGALKIFQAVSASRTLSQALALIDEYKENAAADILAQFCRSYPGEITARFHLHRIYCENYNIIEANQILSEMLSIDSKSGLTLLAEIRNAVFSSELKQAAAFFSKSWHEYSSNEDAIFLKARYDYTMSMLSSAAGSPDYEPVYSSLEGLLKKNISGYKPYIINLMITVAAAGGLFERARPHYIEALKTSGAVDFKTQLACAYFAESAKNYEQAIELFDRASKEKNAPESIIRYAAASAGRIALMTKKYKPALDYFLKLRDLGAPEAPTYIGLIETFGELGDIGGLNAIYGEALPNFKDELMLHYSFGVAKMKMGEYEEAIKAFKTALDINPETAAAYYNLGRSLSAMAEKIEAHSMPWNKFMDEAYNNYKKCLALDEKYHDAYISLGTLALSKSPPDYPDSEKNFNAALKINSNSKEALFNLLSLAGLKADDKMAAKYKTIISQTLSDDEDAMKRLKNYE